MTNPLKSKEVKLEQNFDWMRAVTKQEAENCRNNLENWAKQDKIPRGGQLGDWIFRKINSDVEPEVTFIIVVSPRCLSPGLILSGL